jgi:hypothetical protein
MHVYMHAQLQYIDIHFIRDSELKFMGVQCTLRVNVHLENSRKNLLQTLPHRNSNNHQP